VVKTDYDEDHVRIEAFLGGRLLQDFADCVV
jgi:hypothetical protein